MVEDEEVTDGEVLGAEDGCMIIREGGLIEFIAPADVPDEHHVMQMLHLLIKFTQSPYLLHMAADYDGSEDDGVKEVMH